MRFTSAQLEALLDDDLWLRSASHANEMASRLAAGVDGLDGVEVVHPVEANGVFASSRAPRSTVCSELPGEHPFYIWDDAKNVVRWMCSWDTTPDDVDTFRGIGRRSAAMSLRETAEATLARSIAAMPDRAVRLLAGKPIRLDGQELHPQVQVALRLEERLGGRKPPKIESSRPPCWPQR